MDIAEYPDLGERERDILHYIAKTERAVTAKELLEHLPQYKKTVLHQGLLLLQERGFIQKKGASVSTSYVLSPETLDCSPRPNKEVQVFMDLIRRSCDG